MSLRYQKYKEFESVYRESFDIDFDTAFDSGWEYCKKEILKILKEDIKNLDLSIDSCDKRYIEKIEKEI